MRDLSRRIAELAPEKRKVLEAMLQREGIHLSRAVIVRDGHHGNESPTSFAQQRLWFLDRLLTDSSVYNMPASVRVAGRLDVASLRRSLQDVVRRHEVLRTTFDVRDNRLLQIVHTTPRVTMPVIDLSGLDADTRDVEFKTTARQESCCRFDLASGPLLRVKLLRLGPHEHVLLLTLHHIICDGWSLGIMLRELVAGYQTPSHPRSVPAPELSIQYADFARWQQAWLTGQESEKQFAYWQQQLAGAPALDLPTDRPRPAIQSFRGSVHRFSLPQDLVAQIKRLSQREGVTLFMVLLAALKVLLARHCRQNDVVVGTPVANRNRAETEDLIGCFVNTLVLRTPLSGNPTFRGLLARVRAVCLEAFEHQDAPFEKLVERLSPERELSRNPLFQVMFVLQNAPLPAVRLADIALSVENTDPGWSRFDLTLELTEQNGGLDGSWQFRVDLFDSRTIRRIAAQYQRILAAVANDPGQRISQLPLLAEEDRTLLLRDRSGGKAAYAVERCLPELFEIQAQRTPDAVALVHREEHLTYEQLNSRANQLARHLLERGVAPEVRVALCLERSWQMVVGILGILKAGGAYVPLDATYPASRLAFMLRDSKAAVMITDKRSALVAQSLGFSGHVIDFDTMAEQPPRTRADNLDRLAEPANLCYVIYTSGSTGNPKGTEITHGNVVRLFEATQPWYQFDAHDVWTLFHSYAFDFSVWELWGALIYGGRMVVVPYLVSRMPESFHQLLCDEQVTVLNQTPSAFRRLIAVDQAQRVASPLALRWVIFGGEALDARMLAPWFERHTDQCPRLINMYGITETTVHVTYQPTTRAHAAESGSFIGVALADLDVYVLDGEQNLVPVGVPGELYVGGAGVCRGYLQRPELTAERFLPHPHSDRPGVRWYRTGDLVRWRDSGIPVSPLKPEAQAKAPPVHPVLEFLGRIDHQVKIRGFRIELGEIESLLAQHPHVQQALVLLRDDMGEKRLVGYVASRERDAVSAAELRTYLSGKLPEYMIPSAFVVLDSFPTTPQGKLDAKALPPPETAGLDQAVAFVAPRTTRERQLAQLWSDVLKVDRVGAHENFFALGGDSLKAAILLNRLQGDYGEGVQVITLFQQPTLSALASYLDHHVDSSVRATDTVPDSVGPGDPEGIASDPSQPRRGAAPIPLERVSRLGHLPLSFAQQRFWFLDQLLPSSPLYNVPIAIRIAGPLHFAPLERSLNDVIARHEILRTTFASVEGRPKQSILPRLTVSLSVVDVRGLPQPLRDVQIRRLAREEAQRPFNLEKGPLIRVQAVSAAPDDNVVLLTLHHITSDGWSTAVLMREVAAGYKARSAGKRAILSELPIQYIDYAHWQLRRLQGERLEEQLVYWRQQLADVPLLELPTDRPRPALQSVRGAAMSMALPTELTGALRQLIRHENGTLFHALLAAYQVLLHRYTNQSDFVVGSPVAGRNHAEIEGLIGCFVNNLVLRADLSGNPTVRQLLARVRRVCLEAFANQDVPFERIVQELGVRRDLSREPLFQTMLVLQNIPFPSHEFPAELSIRPLEIHNGTSRFDLTLLVAVDDSEIALQWEYNTDLFDAATIQRMAAHFQVLLESFTATPNATIEELQILTADERRRLLSQWGTAAADYPGFAQKRGLSPLPSGCSTRDAQSVGGQSPFLCLTELIDAQAVQRPDAVALVYENRHMTYSELHGRANQLARHLQSMQIGPEVLVALCLDRSLEMFIGILGTIKSGGAYLPLDPNYPPSRLAFMLADSHVRLLLTSESLAARFAGIDTPVVCLDTLRGTIDRYDITSPSTTLSDQNLAYVIYTSGSTGTPKAAQLEHGGACNLARAQQAIFKLGPDSRVLQFAPASYDASVWEWLMSLCAGGTFVLAPPERLLPGPDLVTLLRAERITVLTAPPSTLAELSPDDPLLDLMTVISAGEPCSAELLAQWAGTRRFFNAYGPTETTVCATIMDCRREQDFHVTPAIGRPLLNAEVYVLGPSGQMAPIGVPGELCVGGAGLARGYLYRAALTAEKFIPHPFSHRPGARLYRTGDLVRWRPDGTLEYVGRSDQQVKVRGHRIELGEIESALCRQPQVLSAVVVARHDSFGHLRLDAYIVAAGNIAPLPAELRDALSHTLPSYMLPTTFNLVDKLPRTPSGKLDRQALPVPDRSRSHLSSPFVPANTEVEQTLADIFQDVLGIARVGILDNFFELGGDSIISIQVVARANQAGLALSTQHIFRYQTVRELAAVTPSSRAAVPQGPVTGPIPLTPIQHWFFEQQRAIPRYFNQSLMLQVHAKLNGACLARALDVLVEHHDALRLRFEFTGNCWHQYYAELSTAARQRICSEMDLTGLPEHAQRAELQQAACELQSSLELSRGPILRCVLFRTNVLEPKDRVLFVIHHLVVDGVSWRILLEDLQFLYAAFDKGGPAALPPKTSSFQAWSQRLREYALQDTVIGEIDYWNDVAEVAAGPSRDLLDEGLPAQAAGGTQSGNGPHESPRNTVGAQETVNVSLTEKETWDLLHEVGSAYRTQVNDQLLTALLLAFRQWCGNPELLIDLEGHGREPLFDDVDLSRTVGWFTTLYPVRLRMVPGGIGQVLKSVKEQLRHIPRKGIGYGVLKYLHADSPLSPRSVDVAPTIGFNYFGQIDALFEESSTFQPSTESAGGDQSPLERRTHPITFNAVVAQGRLEIACSYSPHLHSGQTIEKLANQFLVSLRELIDHCQTPDAGGCTPSDFPLTNLDQPTLDQVLGNGQGIEDVYPLSPVQAGMLFDMRLAAAERPYFLQLLCTLRGVIDVDALRRAWQRVVDRHAILRTQFFDQGAGEPVQLVRRKVELPWQLLDWRGIAADERDLRFAEFLESDREAGFDPETAPLMRMALIRGTDENWEFVWTSHHLLVDGWSLPLLMREVLALYQGYHTGRPTPSEHQPPYRNYIAWLQDQDHAAAEQFWRTMLLGSREPTLLARTRGANKEASDTDVEPFSQQVHVDTATISALRGIARRNQLTLNTVVQGAWAMLLGHCVGSDDVIFGTTVSGRPPDLEGVETIVGPFINVLPLRVRLGDQEPLVDWLSRLQDQHVEMRKHDFCPLAVTQRCSDVPKGPLFDCLMTVENYPFDATIAQNIGDMVVGAIRNRMRTGFSLVILVREGAGLSLEFRNDVFAFDETTVRQLAEQMAMILERFATAPDASCGNIRRAIVEQERAAKEAERRQRQATNLQRFRSLKPTAVRIHPELAEQTATDGEPQKDA